MILKSFLVEKNLSTIENYFVTLFYGENIGLKDDIKLHIKEKYKDFELMLCACLQSQNQDLCKLCVKEHKLL